MGLTASSIKFLMQEGKRKTFTGSIITLGKQDVSVTQDVLRALAQEMRYGLQADIPMELSSRPYHEALDHISDRYLLKRLGFSVVHSSDASDYEGADHVFDLNSSVLPEHLHNQYDVVIDGGTMEHVFHVPNALKNIFCMLKVGGRIIHLSPSSNHLDHGFYMFSPTLFCDYYAANQFQIDRCSMIRYSPHSHLFKWRMFDYTPGCLEPSVKYGGLDDGMYAIALIATKTVHSTGGRIPQQGTYVSMWADKKPAADLTSAVSTKQYLRRRHPKLYRLLAKCAISLLSPFKRKGLKLKVKEVL